MHPIEAKALGFINDDEFRALMHGAIEHRAVSDVGFGKTTTRYKEYTAIVVSGSSDAEVVRNVSRNEAEKQFKAHKDAKYVLVSCRFPKDADRKYEILIKYEYVNPGTYKVMQVAGQTDKLTNGSEKNLQHTSVLEHGHEYMVRSVPSWDSIRTSGGMEANIVSTLPIFKSSTENPTILTLDIKVGEAKEEPSVAASLAQYIIKQRPQLTKVTVGYMCKTTKGYTYPREVTVKNTGKILVTGGKPIKKDALSKMKHR